jgi:hypothetical protein
MAFIADALAPTPDEKIKCRCGTEAGTGALKVQPDPLQDSTTLRSLWVRADADRVTSESTGSNIQLATISQHANAGLFMTSILLLLH